MKRTMKLFITTFDFLRLRALLESARKFLRRDREHLEALAEELSRAEVVEPAKIPEDVVVMNSRVRVTDLETGTQAVYTLTFPRDADLANARISVLAPIGTALLGHRAGAVVKALVPRGTKRLRIDEVIAPPKWRSAA